jgi:hypothetical protein
VSKITTTVSPVLATLFIASDAMRVVVETHQHDVLDVRRPESRGDQVDQNNKLNDALCEIHYAVAGYPADTMPDLKRKLAFMVKEKMGDGQDWLPIIMEDLERIEPTEAPGWAEALKAYEEATTADQVTLDAVAAAESARHEDGHEEAARAVIAAESRQAETCKAQCEAIRTLVKAPAPSVSALLVNMQIAVDTGMIINPDISDALKADLRRFSRYANQEV